MENPGMATRAFHWAANCLYNGPKINMDHVMPVFDTNWALDGAL
jgi:hypothetical protein